MEYHVSKTGSDLNCGSEKEPFLTITKAASVVEECDTVIVHEGIYRECVTMEKGAENPSKRMTFKSADGEKVIIKGSEEIKKWEKHSKGVYKAVISNDFFGKYNPYADVIDGDWFRRPLQEYKIHTGQVYINGNALLEVGTLKDVKNNNWYAEVGEKETVIYANFGDLNPDENVIEINVRQSCFKAGFPGVNNITVSGFEMCHTATQWSAPTAEQVGAITVNLCKGWIIENNHIHNSRCNGICIGKDKSTGHNPNKRFHKKTGHMNQLEVVFSALLRGWSKETAGSHIIRNNIIHDCGQTAIVGHLGCAFSEICGNHIYNIQHADEFWGHEIAGIKFHGAIDTYIHNNCIHDCRRGMWLDWQAQGMRISSNLFFNNNIEDDFYIEVTHGPHTVDNNIMLSGIALRTHAQGGAYVHNFVGGLLAKHPQTRFTPYHFPHSTQIKGISKSLTGDDRHYNNIFVGGKKEETERDKHGTCGYDGSTVSLEEYVSRCWNKNCDEPREEVLYPAYINNNAYLGGAKPFDKEENNSISKTNPKACIVEENGKYYLELNMPEDGFVNNTFVMDTDNLAGTVLAEVDFDNADGTKMIIDRDYLGNKRSKNPTVGPFENLKPGKNRILVWG